MTKIKSIYNATVSALIVVQIVASPVIIVIGVHFLH